VVTGSWFWIVSNRFTVDSAASYDSSELENINHGEELLFDSRSRQLAFKQDAAFQISTSQKLEAGYWARRIDESVERRRFQDSSAQFVNTDVFSATAWQPGLYVQDTITAMDARLALTVGGRLDRLSVTGQNVLMPRASLAFSPLANTRLTVAFGQYAQFPTFRQLFGQFGNANLKAERATHYTIQAEQLLNDKTRVRVEAYDREDRNGIYSADSEYRLVNGVTAGPGVRIPLDAIHLQNDLRGYARGVEVFLERRSVNKLSGWISYGYGVARYRDAATNLSFDGDFDQRHTFNVYTTYRVRPTLNVSTKFRYGSNFPAAGFLLVNGESASLSDQRNQSRIPAYRRLDLRTNKAFNFDRWKLTLYAEVLNVLGRKNLRYEISVDTVNRRLSFDTATMFPRLPIAGLRVEF
jgi:outer membrane receptor protein involved in Fe transport